MSNSSAEKPPETAEPATPHWLHHVDEWMASNPWYPRVAPFAVYLAFLALIQLVQGYTVWAYPVLYGLQCATVAAMLWRYRHLTPELTLRFHWLAIPTGLGLCAAWVALGQGMIQMFPGWYTPGAEPHPFERMHEASPLLYHVSIGMRLLGMAMLVPLFEELFVRSAVLRGFHSPRKTGIGLVQFAEDVPVVGEHVLHTQLAKRHAGKPPQFTEQLNECPVGRITAFGFAISTLVFMLSHGSRDWPGTIACAVVWCALLWYTNRPGRQKLGLGPIAWSHGITNAALWGWVIYSDQWHFL